MYIFNLSGLKVVYIACRQVPSTYLTSPFSLQHLHTGLSVLEHVNRLMAQVRGPMAACGLHNPGCFLSL